MCTPRKPPVGLHPHDCRRGQWHTTVALTFRVLFAPPVCPPPSPCSKATFKESTTTRGTRNIFNRRGSLDDESKETLISIELLNHDKVDVLAKPKDTLLDVCLAVRDQLGLENDGDFSIFLRDHEEYSCLPEQMLAIAADASACTCARAGCATAHHAEHCR